MYTPLGRPPTGRYTPKHPPPPRQTTHTPAYLDRICKFVAVMEAIKMDVNIQKFHRCLGVCPWRGGGLHLEGDLHPGGGVLQRGGMHPGWGGLHPGGGCLHPGERVCLEGGLGRPPSIGYYGIRSTSGRHATYLNASTLFHYFSCIRCFCVVFCS